MSSSHSIAGVSTAVDLALSAIDGWDAPHAAVAVVGPDGILAARGDLDRRSRWASVTKLVTGMAVLSAVDEGRIGLDDAVCVAIATLYATQHGLVGTFEPAGLAAGPAGLAVT